MSGSAIRAALPRRIRAGRAALGGRPVAARRERSGGNRRAHYGQHRHRRDAQSVTRYSHAPAGPIPPRLAQRNAQISDLSYRARPEKGSRTGAVGATGRKLPAWRHPKSASPRKTPARHRGHRNPPWAERERRRRDAETSGQRAEEAGGHPVTLGLTRAAELHAHPGEAHRPARRRLGSATKSDDLYCKFDEGPCAANKRFGLGGSDECDAVLHIAFG